MAQKKPGFLVRLFSWKLKVNDAHNDDDDDDVCDDEEMRRRYKQSTARRHTVATATRQHGGGGLRRPTIKTDQQMMAAASAASLQVDNPVTYTDASLHSSNAAMRKCSSAKTSRSNSAERTAAVDELGLGKSMASPQVVVPRQRKVSSPRSLIGTLNRRSVVGQPLVKGQKPSVDISRPLEFPATPETILEYHKQRPILNENEEWLMVELNQFQCLVDSMDVIKIIAKHSKFFEVRPAELWEEFFQFVDEVPSYDEVINFDVWQEFRDKRYAC